MFISNYPKDARKSTQWRNAIENPNRKNKINKEIFGEKEWRISALKTL
jgi:hypothetical protein